MEEEYFENELNVCDDDIENKRWWKYDFDYLPIHIFQKMVKNVCLDLSDAESTTGRIIDLFQYFWDSITPTMFDEYFIEYEYNYGKNTLTISDLKVISLGYIEGFKQYITKLLVIYIQKDEKHISLKNHIQEVYLKLFQQKRYWNDDSLDKIDNIMIQLGLIIRGGKSPL